MRNFRGFSEYILEMLFPHVHLFFLAVDFKFSFCSTLPSAHFVWHLPFYPIFSIFNLVSNLIDLIMCVFCSFFYVYVS